MEGLLFRGASVIVGSKFTIFALFYFVFEDSFPSTSPWGLIFGGAYTWTGLFSEFYGIGNAHIFNLFWS